VLTVLAQVAITILGCWFGSGIIFGYAALKPVLVAQGVYKDLCAAEEFDGEFDTCYEQELRCVQACVPRQPSAVPRLTLCATLG
jgi:hypothetical protein